MSKDIHCAGCKLFLGTIEEAKIRKNTSYLCRSCEKKRVALELKHQNKKHTTPPSSGVEDFLNTIMRG